MQYRLMIETCFYQGTNTKNPKIKAMKINKKGPLMMWKRLGE